MPRPHPEDLSIPLLIVAASLIAALGAALAPVLWPSWGPLATAIITAVTATCLLPLLSIRLGAVEETDEMLNEQVATMLALRDAARSSRAEVVSPCPPVGAESIPVTPSQNGVQP